MNVVFIGHGNMKIRTHIATKKNHTTNENMERDVEASLIAINLYSEINKDILVEVALHNTCLKFNVIGIHIFIYMQCTHTFIFG